MKTQVFTSMSGLILGMALLAQNIEAREHRLGDPRDDRNVMRISLRLTGAPDLDGRTRSQRIGKRSRAHLTATPNGNVYIQTGAEKVLTGLELQVEPGAWSLRGKLPQAVIAQLIEQSCNDRCKERNPAVARKIEQLKFDPRNSEYFYASAWEMWGSTMSALEDNSEFELAYLLEDGATLTLRANLLRWWR